MPDSNGVLAVEPGPRTHATPAGTRTGAAFDVQGHRGARGLRPENTLPAFGAALELGVATLELDVGVTADNVVVVTHDRLVSPLKCRDTAPTFPADPAFPYLRKAVRALTLDQLKTLDLVRRHPLDPATDALLRTQRPVPGARMATLAEVFELTHRYGADEVRFNIETKVDPRHPQDTLEPETFTHRLLSVIEAYGMTGRASIQSFDWRTLLLARQALPALDRVALAEPRTLWPRWLAGLHLDAFDRDVAAAAAEVGAHALSPDHLFLDRGMLASAHDRGLGVIPWTVNEPAELHRLIELGVDGIITDYPDRLRDVLATRGMPLPRRHAAPAPDLTTAWP